MLASSRAPFCYGLLRAIRTASYTVVVLMNFDFFLKINIQLEITRQNVNTLSLNILDFKMSKFD